MRAGRLFLEQISDRIAQPTRLECDLYGSLALSMEHSNGEHLVSSDAVIETMRQTGNDMSARYKETSFWRLGRQRTRLLTNVEISSSS
jgi:hypothetical protein